MKLLVLGGTGFLGYHVVAEALKAGHEVSNFTREGEAPLPEVEPLQGDRRGDLDALKNRTWDGVLDTFSDPEAVGETARLLSGNVGAYGFISGITNYHPDGPAVVDETSPLRRVGEGNEGDPLQERGIAKLRCEEAVHKEFRGPVFIARTGIMVGPRDPTDRFSWWPVRFARGGEVLAPGNAEREVQFTDARDLARWTVEMLDEREPGTFNTVGPGSGVSLARVLEACRRVDEEEAGETWVTWAGEEFLRESLYGVPEEERPLWFPEDQIPFDSVDSSKALAAGLSFRPVEETARDTLNWVRSRQENREDRELRAGLSPEFERQLLRNWRERRSRGRISR